MKKISLLFIGFMLLTIYLKAQGPKMRPLYVDSNSMNQVANFNLSQVAISGYYENLLHIPSISINGVSQAIVNGQSWTVPMVGPASVILAKSVNYTITTSDFGSSKILYMPVDCTSGNITITEPSASSIAGYTIIITKADATTNSVTISGLGYDNVMNIQYSSKETISDGTTIRQN